MGKERARGAARCPTDNSQCVAFSAVTLLSDRQEVQIWRETLCEREKQRYGRRHKIEQQSGGGVVLFSQWSSGAKL